MDVSLSMFSLRLLARALIYDISSVCASITITSRVFNVEGSMNNNPIMYTPSSILSKTESKNAPNLEGEYTRRAARPSNTSINPDKRMNNIARKILP